VAPRISDINVAARFSLTRGRLALVQDRDDQAQAPLESAFHFYSFHNDAFGIARALLALATLSRRRGNLDEAATQLENAEELISGRTTKRSDYLKFIITTERAHLAVDRGETDLAAELYSEATPGLRQLEKGKFYAYSLLGQADLRCELGEYQESLEIYKEANTVFERYDLKRDSADCQLKTEKALVRLKRYERGERLAQDSLALRRGDPAGESATFAILSSIALQQSNTEEAATRANNALKLADQSRSAESRLAARAALGQV